MRGRALGVDLGERRIGVAVSDDDGLLATPFEVIQRVGDHSVEHGRILAIAAETGAGTIVVGLPYSLDGSDGPAARKVAAEVRGLTRRVRRLDAGVSVVTADERLSTIMAHQSLDSGGVPHRKRREMVDAVAAAVILQGWLDRNTSR